MCNLHGWALGQLAVHLWVFNVLCVQCMHFQFGCRDVPLVCILHCVSCTTCCVCIVHSVWLQRTVGTVASRWPEKPWCLIRSVIAASPETNHQLVYKCTHMNILEQTLIVGWVGAAYSVRVHVYLDCHKWSHVYGWMAGCARMGTRKQ